MRSKGSMRLSIHFMVVCVSVLLGLAFSIKGGHRIQFFLPGSQPGQVDTAVAVATCKVCHLTQFREFYGNMAYAVRDPLFNAQLAISSKTTMPLGLDVGEYCLRCHAPSAWMAGRSHWLSNEFMYGSDLDGVNCDFCHRMVDPLNPDSTVITGGIVPGYGNGMYAVQTRTLPVRGARGLAHPFVSTLQDTFYRKSEYCAVCHDESNVYLTEDPRSTPPHRQVMYQRTYSEWLLSWFAAQGEAGTCQSCHMPRGPGYGSSLPTTPLRLDIASHDFSGGNTVHMRGALDTWEGIDSIAVNHGVNRSRAILKTALKVDVTAHTAGDSVKAFVRLTNLIGHKIPSGFPEGRRLWICLIGRDITGNVVFKSGEYDFVNRNLRQDPQLKVYETRLGISQKVASKYHVEAGPSFNESLNDTVYWDNRIPPKGYRYEKFRERGAEPIGYHYDDGQYWDVTSYSLPFKVHTINVTVYYQVASKEYAEFLRDQNIDNPYDWNDWGKKAYDTWLLYGMPEVVADTGIIVPNSAYQLPPVDEIAIATRFHLGQNFPNPFNGTTTIEFWISQPSQIILTVYDLTGEEILNFGGQELPAGTHAFRFDGSRLSSGLYCYRLLVDGRVQTKKLLLIK